MNIDHKSIEPENYALFLLQNALRDEIQYHQQASEVIEGNEPHHHRTIDSFKESRDLAIKRIPQLEKAIKLYDVLHEIRGACYDRDTDDAILHRIKDILTENGFEWNPED